MPAICVNGGTHDRAVLVSVWISAVVASLLTANPRRHPLIEKDLLNV